MHTHKNEVPTDLVKFVNFFNLSLPKIFGILRCTNYNHYKVIKKRERQTHILSPAWVLRVRCTSKLSKGLGFKG